MQCETGKDVVSESTLMEKEGSGTGGGTGARQAAGRQRVRDDRSGTRRGDCTLRGCGLQAGYR